jgi:CheY-like chemotaxis protein
MPPGVLLVEDDDDIRDSLVEVLVELGCEVVAVASAGAALEQLRGGMRPRFVLLDLLLPDMTGTALLRALKSDPSLDEVPVVLMSASRVTAVVDAPGGVRRVLQKPLRKWQLEQVVRWFSTEEGRDKQGVPK